MIFEPKIELVVVRCAECGRYFACEKYQYHSPCCNYCEIQKITKLEKRIRGFQQYIARMRRTQNDKARN